MRRITTTTLLMSAALALSLSACSSDDEPAAASPTAKPVEQRTATERLAAAYDGGVAVLDATDLKTVAELPLDGFLRLNPAGDDRHVFASGAAGFTLVDLGAWSEGHDDHSHHYTVEPHLTGVVYDAEKPGHVVVHDGRTALFDDGTGTIRILDSTRLAEEDALLTEFTVPAHHGVAVPRADGSVVISVADDEGARTGVAIRTADGKTVATSDECPGLHGEAAAADGVLLFGCQDGVLLVDGETITKVAADHPYARIGNQAGNADSPIVLGDYKTDKDAELERPRQFSLVDTRGAGAIRVVPIDTTYSFRSLARGPQGEAILLGADGALHVFDAESGERTAHYPVIGAWTEPDDWQQAMPVLHVQGSTAYVADPATRTVIAVDLTDGHRLSATEPGAEYFELTGS